MPLRTINADGAVWSVSSTGWRTQYTKDEFTVCFTEAATGAQRVARYSPQGTKAREDSLSQLTDAELASLLKRSQPSWTAVELGYRR